MWSLCIGNVGFLLFNGLRAEWVPYVIRPVMNVVPTMSITLESNGDNNYRLSEIPITWLKIDTGLMVGQRVQMECIANCYYVIIHLSA